MPVIFAVLPNVSKDRFLCFRETVDLCRKAEHVGVAWISVHGRTTEQRHQPVNYEAVKLVCCAIFIHKQ